MAIGRRIHRTHVVLVALVCSSSLALNAHGQGTLGAYTDVKKLPEGYVGQRITELLAVVNSNDPERVRSFITNKCTDEFRDFAPMEDHQQVFQTVYDQSRGLEFYGIRKYEEERPRGEIVVILRSELTQGWQAFVIGIEPKPPHLLAGLQFAPARPPSDLPPLAKLTNTQMGNELENFVLRLAQADAFSGTVLLAKDGRVLYKGAFGLASKRFNAPNKIDTKFNLGSMNKMFTGVAIGQLVQRGKLALDDPLSKFVSTEWLPREITEKIKIKHLLTHTSGLGSYFNEAYMNSSKALFRELEDYKPLISGSTLAFEPGTDWQYSNTGMLMLGVVIESVTGQNYFAYIRDNIAKPAGMLNTDCYEMDRPVPNLAIGYSREPSENGPPWTNNLYKHVIRGGPAGGGFSTVEDLLRFDIALRSHKLLDSKHTEMVWSNKPELKSPDYGFGFGIGGQPGDRIVGHGGGFPGISSNLDMFLDSGYTAVVMSNYDGGTHAVKEKMQELIRRRK